MCKQCSQLKDVWVYPGIEKLKLEYSDGNTALIDYDYKMNIQILSELKQDHDNFTVHDVLTGTSYKAGKKVTND